MLSEQERLIPEMLGITKITIKSDQIPATKYKNHEIEKTINLYDIKDEDKERYFKRPDIYSDNYGIKFAWEVFVTHAVDEEKKQYYKKQNIPYIEIKPIQLDKKNYSSFEFELISYNGFAFSLLTESVYDNLIAYHSSEIFDIYREKIEEQVFDNLIEIAYAESQIKLERDKLDIINNYINDYKVRIKNKLYNKTDLVKLIKEALCTIVDSEEYLGIEIKSNGEWLEFKEAKIISNGKDKPYIGIYDKDKLFYRINSNSYPERLLNMFIESFYNNNRLIALLDKTDKIIGFEIDNGYNPKLSWHYSGSEIYKKKIMETVKLSTRFDDGNNGYRMGSKYQGIYFKSELVLKQIIVNLLNQLHKYYGCWIKPKKEPDKKTPFVAEYLFKITDKDYLINTIMNVIDV